MSMLRFVWSLARSLVDVFAMHVMHVTWWRRTNPIDFSDPQVCTLLPFQDLLFCLSCLGCATAHLCSPQGFAAHELCKGLLKRSATCRSCMQDFQKTQLSKISGAIWTAAGLGFFFSTHMLDMLVILWPNKHTLARALFTVEGETSKIPVGKDRRDLRRSAASVPWAVIPSCVKLARNDKKIICEAFKGWRSSKCEASLAEVSCIMSEAADSSTQCLLNYLRCIYSHSMSVFPARFAFIRKKLAKSWISSSRLRVLLWILEALKVLAVLSTGKAAHSSCSRLLRKFTNYGFKRFQAIE